MTNDFWNAVWERVRSGEPAMVIGPHLPPSVPSGLQVLRISCEAADSGGGPLAAVDLQRQVGDVIGLARSTAALATVCSATGRLGEAVALLADSVTLNFQKGSPLGLAVNRRSLDDLVGAAAREQGPEGERLRDAVAEVERRLAQAEAILGRMVLPGVENGTC
jgi:hypothetical protein